MQIRHLPKVITVPVGQINYKGLTQPLRIPNTFERTIFKSVRVWFSPGCATTTLVKIQLNGGQLIPDPMSEFADGVAGDDNTVPFNIDMTIAPGDTIDILTKNIDPLNAHTIVVFLELKDVPLTPKGGAVYSQKQEPKESLKEGKEISYREFERSAFRTDAYPRSMEATTPEKELLYKKQSPAEDDRDEYQKQVADARRRKRQVI